MSECFYDLLDEGGVKIFSITSDLRSLNMQQK